MNSLIKGSKGIFRLIYHRSLPNSERSYLYSNVVKNSTFTLNKPEFNLSGKFETNHIEFSLNNNLKNIDKKYPYIWLRDLCRCPQCFNQKTEEKTIALANISIDIKPNFVASISKKDCIEITCNFKKANTI